MADATVQRDPYSSAESRVLGFRSQRNPAGLANGLERRYWKMEVRIRENDTVFEPPPLSGYYLNRNEDHALVYAPGRLLDRSIDDHQSLHAVQFPLFPHSLLLRVTDPDRREVSTMSEQGQVCLCSGALLSTLPIPPS